VIGASAVVNAPFDGGTANTEPVDPRIQQESGFVSAVPTRR